MRKTKQQEIDELKKQIEGLYSVYEYNTMKKELEERINELHKDHDYTKMCLQSTQIQLATYKGMVDIFERFTETKLLSANEIVKNKLQEFFEYNRTNKLDMCRGDILTLFREFLDK